MQRGEQIQAKEIAERFRVMEASVSRTWKMFKEKIYFKKNKNGASIVSISEKEYWGALWD